MSPVQPISPPPPAPAAGADDTAAPASAAELARLLAESVPGRINLTDFLDLRTLQDLQDIFSALTRLRMTILDAQGAPLTAPTNAAQQASSAATLEFLIAPGTPTMGETAGPLAAPIVVEEQRLGTVVIEEQPGADTHQQDRDRLAALYARLGAPAAQVPLMLDAAERAFSPRRAVAVQTLFLLANHLARLCYQGYQIKERVEELAALNKLSAMLAGTRDLQQVLDAAAHSVAEVMNVKAAAVRLLNEETQELEVKAVHNLSESYVGKGPIHLERSQIAYQAFNKGEVVYVEDMRTDPRVVYPDDAEREGLISFLVAGMVYQGRPIGLVQVYSGRKQRFSRFDENLLRSIAQLAAAAIANARLNVQRAEGERVRRQLAMAADVQRRMLPMSMPRLPPLDIAARYVPSFELGGDFYDFISLEGHLGVAVCDVSGKGIAASLLMASVRASLRAYAQDVYDIDEIIARVNTALVRDTQTNEFATLFYGVLDPQTRRLTYCNAGHEPPLLLRGGQITRLETGGTVVGIDPEQHYDKSVLYMHAGDTLLLYTDGLTDAQNFDGEKFGRDRINKALLESADKSASDAVDHILWEMRRFVGLRSSIDDTTLVVIKIGGKK